jgi:pyridoxine 5'-phosphate synthase PdxJ
MAKRPETPLSKKSDQEEPAPEVVSQRKRPEQGQFRLQVDRQTKGAYETSEAAEAVGMAIKKGHPIVQVSVYDVVKHTNKIIELP